MVNGSDSSPERRLPVVVVDLKDTELQSAGLINHVKLVARKDIRQSMHELRGTVTTKPETVMTNFPGIE